MDSITSTEELYVDLKTPQENILLEIIKEICNDTNNNLPTKLVGKINRIIADCDLTHYTSLHKLSTTDESTSTILGFMHQTATELTFAEQAQLNQAVIQKIQKKIPIFSSELECLKQNVGKGKTSKSRKDEIKELQESLDEKLNTLREQENEKVEIMMEWLNHRLNDVSTFTNNTNEVLTLKTRILELKSKILHLQMLRNIFTETNQSIKAYSEVHKDLKESIKETEHRIKNFKDIIEKDYN